MNYVEMVNIITNEFYPAFLSVLKQHDYYIKYRYNLNSYLQIENTNLYGIIGFYKPHNTFIEFITHICQSWTLCNERSCGLTYKTFGEFTKSKILLCHECYYMLVRYVLEESIHSPIINYMWREINIKIS